ncbi:MAG: hypothetical protein K0R26_177 [Bacteroidota bacterium]|jgi:hypothetical protein|nr:hypothetical protein [Bacteroidota bacterium]
MAQEDGGKNLRNHRNNPIIKTRIGFSPVLNFYKTNKNHATKARPKMSFNVSLKEEIRLDRHNRSFLLIGAEYFHHGLSFNSYFFFKDSLQLYTADRLKYKYSLTLQELNFPLQIKHSFQKETNAIFSSYVFAGYCYRLILAGQLKVEDNGSGLTNINKMFKFKNPAFSASGNSFLCAGAGIQKNTPLRHNAVYAELQFRYGLSPFYFQEPFSASGMYINSHCLLLTVGFKI